MTRDLIGLSEWLHSLDVDQVAMESTGVFWQPIYNVLEDTGINLLVANARHIKAVPDRKTDVKDAEWLADLLRHGLIRGSAIPTRARRELRELVRYRMSLGRQRAQVAHRIHKVLERANVKLGVVTLTGHRGTKAWRPDRPRRASAAVESDRLPPSCEPLSSRSAILTG
jgi:transposase